jgi:hypothetical protein
MMYFLFGEIKGLTIFRENSLNKYILLILALATVTETAQLWVPQEHLMFSTGWRMRQGL